MTRGIDVSHHQKAIRWPEVVADFAFMKCTQGTGFVDPRFKENKAGARAAGILAGFYHFAGNLQNSGAIIAANPIAEADHFLRNVGDILPGELVILDWEIDHAQPSDWCRVWLARVEDKLGFKPLFYTYEARIRNTNFDAIALAGYPLWIAKYGDNDQIPEPNEVPKTFEWPYYLIWQFSSTGQKAGISTRVDLNESPYDIPALMRHGKPGEVPAPVPGIEPVIITPGKVISNWQKNAEWRNIPIGQSNTNVGAEGCLITDVSDYTYWNGRYYTPGQLAKLLDFTDNGKLYWESLKKCGVKFIYRHWKFDKEVQAIVDKAIAHPTMGVFLEVSLKTGHKHWVWALSARLPRYRMADPLHGDFSNTWLRYGGRVTGAAIVDKM